MEGRFWREVLHSSGTVNVVFGACLPSVPDTGAIGYLLTISKATASSFLDSLSVLLLA